MNVALQTTNAAEKCVDFIQSDKVQDFNENISEGIDKTALGHPAADAILTVVQHTSTAISVVGEIEGTGVFCGTKSALENAKIK